jgi:hypothetical protein
MLGYKIICSALQIGFPYFHELRLSSEPARAKKNLGLTVISPRNLQQMHLKEDRSSPSACQLPVAVSGKALTSGHRLL